ncbi:hypothetical protein [Oscillibacter sp.]|uniref:hypothetical protein n=1 Tax=Oscillibacter sp. TaxID=1945593 RepID=UPI0028A00D15|nr:hypothetical protein [Oscillibacter sp.]
MKKKMMSLALAVVMCMTLAVSASATPATPQASEYGNLIRYSEGQSSTVAQVKKSSRSLEISAPESKQAQRLVSRPISPDVNIRQIMGYPIVYCTEDNAVYYFDGIRSIAGWTTSPQSASLRLTSNEIAILYNQVNSAVAGLNDGKTYTIVGWRLLATVDLSADNPINVK